MNKLNDATRSLLIGGALIVGVIGLIWVMWYFSQPAQPTVNVEPFAKCLAEKKATMYGAYWCTHCQSQKAMFGKAFQYVPYVECTEETKLCTDKKIEGFPTWLIPDGQGGEKSLVGEQTFEALAAASGCAVPQ
jgi:hypothetical protein